MNETMNFLIFMVMWRYGILLGWWVSDLDASFSFSSSVTANKSARQCGTPRDRQRLSWHKKQFYQTGFWVQSLVNIRRVLKSEMTLATAHLIQPSETCQQSVVNCMHSGLACPDPRGLLAAG